MLLFRQGSVSSTVQIFHMSGCVFISNGIKPLKQKQTLLIFLAVQTHKAVDGNDIAGGH